jgi:hypothetical protein
VQRHPESWPPPWGATESDPATVVGSARPAAGVGKFPPAGWPTKAQIDYAQAAILLGLLLLALPWVVSKLLSDPGLLLTGLGHRAVRKADL